MKLSNSYNFFPHLFPGTRLGWGVCSVGEDLLQVHLPRYQTAIIIQCTLLASSYFIVQQRNGLEEQC